MKTKNLKTAFTLAMVALLSAGMSSCKEDEEEEKGKTVHLTLTMRHPTQNSGRSAA